MEPLESWLYAQGPWCGGWQELTPVLLAITMTVMTATVELAMMAVMAMTMMKTVVTITVTMMTDNDDDYNTHWSGILLCRCGLCARCFVCVVCLLFSVTVGGGYYYYLIFFHIAISMKMMAFV